MKITREGQPCRTCGTPVEKRAHPPEWTPKPGQAYWFEWWFVCPLCGTMYTVEAAKRSSVPKTFFGGMDSVQEVSVSVYADGSCLGTPGPGGWAFVLVKDGEILKEASGHEDGTTNNRMELASCIEALKSVGGRAVLFTDSKYVKLGITEWLPRWKRNGWRRTDGKPVKNQDLWEALGKLSSNAEWRWVEGHAGNAFNERADELAKAASSGKTVSLDLSNPVQSLINLLGSLPGDYASWREIIEEPYG